MENKSCPNIIHTVLRSFMYTPRVANINERPSAKIDKRKNTAK
jgi:hypothetical protein